MDYVIKQVPEDFVVRESLDIRTGAGPYSYYLLRKRDWTTQKAVDRVARAFGKRSKFVNFSGNKDRQAVTEQYISILHGPGRDLELSGGEITVKFLGRGNERLNLGSSPGNEFEITVRKLPAGFAPKKVGQVPNYFDEQRFGMNRNNHLAGMHIIRREFREACSLIPETRDRLSRNPNDFVGALRSLPRRVIRLYAHSYQSWLWNLSAMRILEKSPHRKVSWPLGYLIIPTEETDNMKIPILGYDTKIPPELEGLLGGILEEEGLELEDFRVPQFPEFDLAGQERDLLVDPGNLSIGEPEDDELNPGTKKVLVKFFLQKGSYATMAIRSIFS
jgi:tRNA pseudouridine13 synthase